VVNPAYAPASEGGADNDCVVEQKEPNTTREREEGTEERIIRIEEETRQMMNVSER
jgi:hypothetical protein